jgi:hypothetical protein
MPRYDFVSPGALAGNAIQEFLIRRALEERQARMDQMAAERQKADIGLRESDLGLRREQEARIAEAQRQQQGNLEQEREFRRASTLAENAMPGDPVDADTQAMLSRQGFGGSARTLPGQPASEGYGVLESLGQPAPGSGVLAKMPPPGVLQPAQPERTIARGGSKYLAARTAADERAALAAEAEAGRTERAVADREERAQRGEADRQLRELIARMQSGTSAESKELRNELVRLQTAIAQDKLETTQAERAKTEKTKADAATNTLALLDRLEKHPGLDKAYGAYEMRGFTQEARDFKAIRDQAVAALTLPNLGSLKGPMSDKDVAFVKQLATRLQDPKISEAEARRAISDARSVLEGRTLESAGTETPEQRRKRLYDELTKK